MYPRPRAARLALCCLALIAAAVAVAWPAVAGASGGAPEPATVVLDTTSMPGMTMTRTATPAPAPATVELDTTSMPGMTMTRTVTPTAAPSSHTHAPATSSTSGSMPGMDMGGDTPSSRSHTALLLGGFGGLNAAVLLTAGLLRRRRGATSRDGAHR